MKRLRFSLRDLFVAVTICGVVASLCSAVKVCDARMVYYGSRNIIAVTSYGCYRPPSGSEIVWRFVLWAPIAWLLYRGSRWGGARIGELCRSGLPIAQKRLVAGCCVSINVTSGMVALAALAGRYPETTAGLIALVCFALSVGAMVAAVTFLVSSLRCTWLRRVESK